MIIRIRHRPQQFTHCVLNRHPALRRIGHPAMLFPTRGTATPGGPSYALRTMTNTRAEEQWKPSALFQMPNT